MHSPLLSKGFMRLSPLFMPVGTNETTSKRCFSDLHEPAKTGLAGEKPII